MPGKKEVQIDSTSILVPMSFTSSASTACLQTTIQEERESSLPVCRAPGGSKTELHIPTARSVPKLEMCRAQQLEEHAASLPFLASEDESSEGSGSEQAWEEATPQAHKIQLGEQQRADFKVTCECILDAALGNCVARLGCYLCSADGFGNPVGQEQASREGLPQVVIDALRLEGLSRNLVCWLLLLITSASRGHRMNAQAFFRYGAVEEMSRLLGEWRSTVDVLCFCFAALSSIAEAAPEVCQLTSTLEVPDQIFQAMAKHATDCKLQKMGTNVLLLLGISVPQQDSKLSEGSCKEACSRSCSSEAVQEENTPDPHRRQAVLAERCTRFLHEAADAAALVAQSFKVMELSPRAVSLALQVKDAAASGQLCLQGSAQSEELGEVFDIMAPKLARIASILDPAEGHAWKAQAVVALEKVPQLLVQILGVAPTWAWESKHWVALIIADAARGHVDNAESFVNAGAIEALCAVLETSQDSVLNLGCVCALGYLVTAIEEVEADGEMLSG